MSRPYNKEQTEISITIQDNFKKWKQLESCGKSSANKFTDKRFDYFQHLSFDVSVKEYCSALLKVEDLREYEKMIQDIVEGEKWHQFFLIIV